MSYGPYISDQSAEQAGRDRVTFAADHSGRVVVFLETCVCEFGEVFGSLEEGGDSDIILESFGAHDRLGADKSLRLGERLKERWKD